MNSIKSNQTKEDTVDSIKLNLFHPSSPKIHIIVEGITDIKFLNSMLDGVYLYESFSGKNGIFDILDIIDSKFVIGICDRDYDSNNYNRVLYYDYHSLESMMVATNNVFNKVLDEFLYIGAAKEIFKNSVFLCANPISIMRRENFIRNLEIRFEGIKPSHYVEHKVCSVEKLINKCKEINGSIDNDLELLLLSLDRSQFDISNLHGHDVMSIIAHLVESSIKPITIEIMFRLAYSKNDFIESTLHQHYVQYLNGI